MATRQVSMTAPVDEQQIAQRRRMAELLQQESMSPVQNPSVGGIPVPMSWTQGLAKIMQGYAGHKANEDANVQAKALMDEQQGRRQADMSTLLQALQGRPAQAAGLSEDASGNVSEMPAMPGQSPMQGLTKAIPMMSPEMQPMAMQMFMGERDRSMPKGPIKGRPGDVFLDPSTFEQVGAVPEAPKDEGQWGEPYQLGGQTVQKHSKTGQIRQAVTQPARTTLTASPTIAVGKGDTKYIEQRNEDMAASFKDLEKAADSAYKQTQTIDRFVEASKKGTAGGAQPIISGVQNFLASFGYEPKDLKDVRVMEQAIGDILGNKMAELGARGLTDKDMEILRQALPRVAIDRASREAVAGILRKSAEFTLNEYESAVAHEETTYPEFAKRARRPAWLKTYRDTRAKSKLPPGVTPEEWNAMSAEDRALFNQ